MAAATLFDPHTVFGLFSLVVIVAAGFAAAVGYYKSKAVGIWRDAAEGYKVRVDELEEKLDRVTAMYEERIAHLESEVERLSGLTDVTPIQNDVRALRGEVAAQTHVLNEREHLIREIHSAVTQPAVVRVEP